MGLSGRKEKILQAVVDSYINSCEPISSAEIKEQHLPALSTATIRNELAALEEMGYLVQPHTSAGRIPTAEAYRLYVERLMPKRKLTRSELKTVKRYFNRKITELDDILKNTAAKPVSGRKPGDPMDLRAQLIEKSLFAKLCKFSEL